MASFRELYSLDCGRSVKLRRRLAGPDAELVAGCQRACSGRVFSVSERAAKSKFLCGVTRRDGAPLGGAGLDQSEVLAGKPEEGA